MQIQRSFVLTPHSLRSGPPRCPKTGERVVTAFAAQQPTPVADEPGFNEMLETSTTIGEAVFDVVLDEAIEAVAEVGRVQAEHQRIIFQAKDLQGAVNELLQDIQTRGIPSPTDVLQRAASVLVWLQLAFVVEAQTLFLPNHVLKSKFLA